MCHVGQLCPPRLPVDCWLYQPTILLWLFSPLPPLLRISALLLARHAVPLQRTVPLPLPCLLPWSCLFQCSCLICFPLYRLILRLTGCPLNLRQLLSLCISDPFCFPRASAAFRSPDGLGCSFSLQGGGLVGLDCASALSFSRADKSVLISSFNRFRMPTNLTSLQEEFVPLLLHRSPLVDASAGPADVQSLNKLLHPITGTLLLQSTKSSLGPQSQQ